MSGRVNMMNTQLLGAEPLPNRGKLTTQQSMR